MLVDTHVDPMKLYGNTLDSLRLYDTQVDPYMSYNTGYMAHTWH